MEVANVTGDHNKGAANSLVNQDSSFANRYIFRKDTCQEEDLMARSMPVNFSPAKYAFFYSDKISSSSASAIPSSIDSFDRFKSDKASFSRTDVLLSPKYRGKVNLFDSSFDDFETQLTKIDSIPIKSEESLDDITEKSDTNDSGSQKVSSNLNTEAGFVSDSSDHSIFTLVSPSKFQPRQQANRLSVSSDSKVELGKLGTNRRGSKDEDESEKTPTSQSFQDVSEDFLESSDKETKNSLKRVSDNKYSTIATFSLEKEMTKSTDDGTSLRKSLKMKSVSNRNSGLTNRFSKSQETYHQSDPDDSSDLDASRTDEYDFDDESLAISLDPIDCNYDSASMISGSTESYLTAVNAEWSPEETKDPSGDDDDADDAEDFVDYDLVSFARNFDWQSGRDAKSQEVKCAKMVDEKIPSDGEFILNNSLQTKKKHFKKNIQPPVEETPSSGKHQNNLYHKVERVIHSCTPDDSGNSTDPSSLPVSPSKKYVSVLSKSVNYPLSLSSSPGSSPASPNFAIEEEPWAGSHGVDEQRADVKSIKSGSSPSSKDILSNQIPCLTPEGTTSSNESSSSRGVGDETFNKNSTHEGTAHFIESETRLFELPGGLTNGQRMLLSDFKIVSQRGSRERERPSAARLAKRLYYLQGFKKSDITRHLSKRNSFALLVGEEYLRFYDFTGERLEESLKKFFKSLAFVQEIPCDKDRLMQHFAHRYFACNPEQFEDEVLVHSLAYALLILDNDLNNQTSLQKVTSQDFVDNFFESQMSTSASESISKDFLLDLYCSIRDEPLEIHMEDIQIQPLIQQPQQQLLQPQQRLLLQTTPLASSPYGVLIVDNGSAVLGRNGIQLLAAMDKSSSIDTEDQLEFKKGYVMRKCCLDANGRKTGLGRRGWKMFYAVLRDTTLFLYSSERASKSKKSRYARSNYGGSRNSINKISSGDPEVSSISSEDTSTPKKSLGTSIKSKVLGKLGRGQKSKSSNQEAGFNNAAADEEEESGNSISGGVNDDECANLSSVANDESDDNDNESLSKFDNQNGKKSSDISKDGSLPRDFKYTKKSSLTGSAAIANGANTISLLHGLATKATDYTKKSHVLRLHTVDQSQYLIQTSDMKECQDWMDCINIVASLHSGPIPDKYFEVQKRFNRPMTNLECSTLSIKEQIFQHERTAGKYEKLLLEYRKSAPEKGSRNRVIREYCHRENFLKFEIKRFKVYTKLLQYQLNACPQLEPSLAETIIGEVEEPCPSPVTTPPLTFYVQPFESEKEATESPSSPPVAEMQGAGIKTGGFPSLPSSSSSSSSSSPVAQDLPSDVHFSPSSLSSLATAAASTTLSSQSPTATRYVSSVSSSSPVFPSYSVLSTTCNVLNRNDENIDLGVVSLPDLVLSSTPPPPAAAASTAATTVDTTPTAATTTCKSVTCTTAPSSDIGSIITTTTTTSGTSNTTPIVSSVTASCCPKT